MVPNTAFAATLVPSADCDRNHKVCASKTHYANFASSSKLGRVLNQFKQCHISGYIADGSAWQPEANVQNVTGYYAVDNVTLGDSATVRYQSFVEGVNVENDYLATAQFDGVLGLNFENKTSPLNFVSNLNTSGAITQASFALYINRDTAKPTTSVLSLGGFDSSKVTGGFNTHLVMLQANMQWALMPSRITVITLLLVKSVVTHFLIFRSAQWHTQ